MSATPRCTCKAKDSYVAAKSHVTEVDDEGICIHCGYYAVWESDYDLFPKSYFGIHGYKQVSSNPTPEWSQEQIDNYFSHIEYDHENFAVFSKRKNNLDYSGVGKGSKKSRLTVNKKFNRRTHL